MKVLAGRSSADTVNAPVIFSNGAGVPGFEVLRTIGHRRRVVVHRPFPRLGRQGHRPAVARGQRETRGGADDQHAAPAPRTAHRRMGEQAHEGRHRVGGNAGGRGVRRRRARTWRERDLIVFDKERRSLTERARARDRRRRAGGDDHRLAQLQFRRRVRGVERLGTAHRIEALGLPRGLPLGTQALQFGVVRRGESGGPHQDACRRDRHHHHQRAMRAAASSRPHVSSR